MDVCQILMGQTHTYFRECTNLHTVSTGENVLFTYTRGDVLSKDSRFCFFAQIDQDKKVAQFTSVDFILLPANPKLSRLELYYFPQIKS